MFGVRYQEIWCACEAILAWRINGKSADLPHTICTLLTVQSVRCTKRNVMNRTDEIAIKIVHIKLLCDAAYANNMPWISIFISTLNTHKHSMFKQQIFNVVSTPNTSATSKHQLFTRYIRDFPKQNPAFLMQPMAYTVSCEHRALTTCACTAKRKYKWMMMVTEKNSMYIWMFRTLFERRLHGRYKRDC